MFDPGPRRTTVVIKMALNSVSSQRARGKSSIAQKLDVHPKYFNAKNFFKNVNLLILNFILVS